ncbi:MAG: hypothetical protein ACOY3H_04715 [Bacillota bacterium]
MGTTILGVFDSPEHARQAITELRDRLQNQNVAIIMRESQPEAIQEDWNLPQTWNDLARDTMQLAQSSGQLAGRVVGATLSTMFAFPAMITSALTPVTSGRAYSWRSERDSRVMVTVQGTDSVGEALDILKRNGAREINTYSN